jgi:hypothetical protein
MKQTSVPERRKFDETFKLNMVSNAVSDFGVEN